MKAKVYFTPEITAVSLIKIYEALGRKLHGKVAVKIKSAVANESIYSTRSSVT